MPCGRGLIWLLLVPSCAFKLRQGSQSGGGEVDLDYPPSTSAQGWVQKREHGRRAYFDFHIPKTAGTSWAADARKVLPKGQGYYSKESCFYHPGPMAEGDRVVVMLRHPVAHVYSQYMECRYREWGRGRGEALVLEEKVLKSRSTWLKHFAEVPLERVGKVDDLNCYHPYNMQARALTCKDEGKFATHHYKGDLDLNLALKNMEGMFFVGLQEHYQASVCLFFAKTHPKQPLPSWCDCRDKKAWHNFTVTHFTHHVPPHSTKDFTKQDLAIINNLTSIDQEVYKAALQRLRREAKEVEKITGTKVMC